MEDEDGFDSWMKQTFRRFCKRQNSPPAVRWTTTMYASHELMVTVRHYANAHLMSTSGFVDEHYEELL